MQFTVLALLGSAAFVSAAPGLGARSDGPDNSLISCGCDYLSDASISDCQAAIDQIDKSANDATDPMQAIDTVHTGALGSESIMHRVGSCSIGAGTFQTINGPGGVGGGDTGTLASGQVLHDVMQAILDGCKDTDNNKVNGCASIGAGDVALGGL